MNFNGDRHVRFEEWNSVNSFGSETQSPSRWLLSARKPSFTSMVSSIRRGFEKGSERIKSLKRSLYAYPKSNQPTKEPAESRKKVLDPRGSFLQRWNKIFVISCIIAVSLDPLFFYVPVVDNTRKCLDLDNKLKIIASVLRSVTDLFYILHIILQFRTGYIVPSRVFGRGDLIEDLPAIAKRYLRTYFIVDVLAILPFPQVVILLIPKLSVPTSLVTKNLLEGAIFTQYVPRLIRIYPLYKEVTRTSGIFTETAWAGAAFNLFLYMLASNVLGAFWYIFSVERQDKCWRIACGKHEQCHTNGLYCDVTRTEDYSFLNTSCPLLEQNQIKNPTDFDFGIFLDALRSQVVEKRNFWEKLFYCFWWGLRNLSSVGQNLKTSNFVGESLFAIAIAIVGLILFSLLIGNMQKYLQSITVRVEEMRVKRRDAEQWMSHRMLPEDLKERIRRYEQYKWQETRGVQEDQLIQNFPKDLRRDINRHLCWALLTRVPMFEKMDVTLLDALCDHLKPALFTEKSLIIREGDPVDEMLFIMRGNLLTMTTNGGRTGFFNSDYLKAGDFCGEELLTWALDPNSSSSLRTSTRTVQAVTDVEAFALKADDLKFVAAQYRRLQSKKIQHIFRFYSQQWRTWAACFIQAAWRRYCRKKLEKSLKEEEERQQNELAGGNLTSLGATIYASKFAANALRALRRNHPRLPPKLSPRVPPLLLQKPAEPDFSAEDRSRASP